MIVLDGAHRGEIGRVVAAGGGIIWVKIADVDELVILAAASVEQAATSSPRSTPRGGSEPQP